MANQIRLKRASGSDPGASDLVTGEVAIRTDTGKIFTKKDDNSVVEVGVGISDVVDDTSPQLGGTLDTNGNLITFGDSTGVSSNRLKFGAGPDLQISHNGTNSIIQDSGTGGLFLLTDNLVVKNANSNETILTGTQDGAVELYHDNTKKFETTANGADINSGSDISMDSSGNGQLRVVGNGYSGGIALDSSGLHLYHNSSSRAIIFGINETEVARFNTSGNFDIANDSARIRLGTSADLQIYHDGSNSFIDEAGTGGLKIRVAGTGDNGFYKYASDEKLGIFIPDGAVELYHNNSKKFETTSDGVKIKNTITMEEASGSEAYQFSVNSFGGLDINNETTKIAEFTDSSTFNLLDNVKITCGTGSDLEIYHNGSHSIIDNSNGTGDLKLIGDDVIIQAGNDDIMAKFIQDGAVELYHNGTKKLETDSVGTIFADDIFFADNLKVNLGNSSDLQLSHNGSNSQIVNITGHLLIGSERIKLTNPAHGHVYLDATLAGSVDLYHNNSKKFETTSSGVSVTGGVTASGASTFNEDVTFTGTNVNIVFDKTADAFEFKDNAEARFGTGDDLKIYHDGSNSYIKDAGTGQLIINSNEFRLNSEDNSQQMIGVQDGGSVDLYHNGSQKLQTTSSGVKVTGDVLPNANNSRNLGSSSLRWQNLFVNDMHFANSVDNPNKVDGTWGDWTLQEGEDTIYMLNNRNGKQYKMNLTEV